MNLRQTKGHGCEELTDEQVRALAITLSDIPTTLGMVPEELSAAIIADQEDVAETRRQAQSNRKLLEQVIGGAAIN